MIAATSTNEVPTMPYVRISIARPRPGQERRLEELQAQIAAFNARQPGCQQSWALHPTTKAAISPASASGLRS
jgi:hypothetical protein